MSRFALALAVLVAAAGSCVGGGRVGSGNTPAGGGGNGGGEANPAVAPASQAMPALPAAHGGSTIPEVWIFGRDALDCSPGSVVEGTALRLGIASPPFPGWAMYRFSLTHALGSLRVRLDAPEGGAYVGLSDYGKGGWKFDGPYSSDAVILPHDGKRYESSTGEVYCLVVASGKPVTVKQIVAKTVFGKPVVVMQYPANTRFSSVALAVANGAPAICYDVRGQWLALMYVRAMDPDGVSWAKPVQVYRWHGDGGVYPSASYLSLAEVNGRPAIGASIDLRQLAYLSALDSIGSVWASPAVLDAVDQGLYFPSPALVDGRPAFTYVVSLWPAENDLELRYVRALDADGSTWGAATTLERTSHLSEWSSLAAANGKPAVSFHTSLYGWDDNWYDCLAYRQAGDASGSAWPALFQVPDKSDYGKRVGVSSSLAIVGANPAIAYRGGYEHPGLYFVRALDADGAGWGTPVVVDADPHIGLSMSLAVVGGTPAVLYCTSYDQGDQHFSDRRYVRALDANGDVWDTPVIVNGGGGGGDRALVAVNGKAAVAFCSDGAVYYMRSF